MVKFHGLMTYILVQSVGLLVVLCGLGCSPEEEVLRVIRILIPDSPGLIHDAKIYQEVFQSHNLKVEPIVLNAEMQIDKAKAPYKGAKILVNLFIEHVDPIEATRLAKHNWLMVNDDHVDEPSRLANIDMVLCKTRLAVELMKKYRDKYNMKFKIYFTKFTTNFDPEPNTSKDFNLAVHLAGKSPYKNTGSVLKSWLQNQNNTTFPKLIITCRDINEEVGCLASEAKPVLDQNNLTLSPNLKTPKLELYTDSIDQKQIKTWQNSAGYYVVPSSVEGYGHYLNEGRAAGSVIITTNAAPMNEMVVDGISGFLVPVKESKIKNEYSMALKHSIDENELTRVINNVFSLPDDVKLKIGKKARMAFLEDTEFFKDKMKVLTDGLIKFENLQHVPNHLFAQ